MEKYLNSKEVAEILHKTEDTINEYAREGKLKGKKNGQWLFAESDIEAYLTGGQLAEQSKVELSEEDKEFKEASHETKLAQERAEKERFDNEAHAAKTQRQLREKGYESLEQAEKAIGEKIKEADDYSQRVKLEANAILKAAHTEGAKVVDAWNKVKAEKQSLQDRLERAIASETAIKKMGMEAENWKAFLYVRTNYHNSHIVPCRRALKKVNITINSWLEYLQDGRGNDDNIVRLINSIGHTLRVIDLYLDHTKEPIPEGIMDIVEAEKHKDDDTERLLKDVSEGDTDKKNEGGRNG